MKLTVLDCNMLIENNCTPVPLSFSRTDRSSLLPGLQLLLLWSHQSSCDQSHSLKLGFSIFLPLMATVTMCAAAALSQPPAASVPCLALERYLAWGVSPRLSLFSLQPPQRQTRISPAVFLSSGFLNCLRWAVQKFLVCSCLAPLLSRLPPSIHGLFECDGSKVLKLFQFLASCWVHRICLLCAHFE